ncbi:hypothetical protein [Altibacter sp. HG106]|uniref:hypothetical protein n=1 Tax=Altibacter sp. HG106 TaxID=3023937 RepID=UPI002350C6F2|nr:hypothetical protein [Altibacter sp. HG106]MDC7995636.1 hypothetical protein [Altibacter sp. HG106]
MQKDTLTILNKTLFFYLCLAIACYFLCLYFLSYFEIKSAAISVIRESITIPLLVSQLILVITGIKSYSSEKNNYILAGISILLVSTLLTFGSFV